MYTVHDVNGGTEYRIPKAVTELISRCGLMR
jgi:hypothetical protein